MRDQEIFRLKEKLDELVKQEETVRRGIEQFECVEILIEEYETKIKRLEDKLKALVDENKANHSLNNKLNHVNNTLLRNIGNFKNFEEVRQFFRFKTLQK